MKICRMRTGSWSVCCASPRDSRERRHPFRVTKPYVCRSPEEGKEGKGIAYLRNLKMLDQVNLAKLLQLPNIPSV